uniref:Uncharacterized protein n=1 Tax=Caenorhabditis japonica TaxID=281687 RepID=A0A8R1DMS2_CAEJA
MTMVCTPDIDTEIDANFSCMEELEFPEIHLPFPPKTLKEQKWEQEMERVRRIKEHEKRFEEDLREISAFVNDCEFLGSEDSDASMDSGVSSTNIFRDDLESFNIQNNNDHENNFQATQPHTSDLKYTCFDLLHCSRSKVKWSSEVYKKFQDASDLLNESLKSRAIPRIRNAPKRIANAERVRLTQGRYTQEQIKRKNESAPLSKFVDLFGYFRLLPQALSPEETENDKIQETAFKKDKPVVYKKP